jgi:NADH:ubiquinone oxidoreductase subunit 5 (subunit L)/multisubunit Na+/H+ antiporter MnhA subunit
MLRDFSVLNFNLIFFKVYSFLSKKWYFDLLYNKYIVSFFFKVSYFVTFKYIDRGVLEYLGPLGLVRAFNSLSNNLSKLQSGYVFHYIFLIILSLISTVFLLFINELYPTLFNFDFELMIVLFIYFLLITGVNRKRRFL